MKRFLRALKSGWIAFGNAIGKIVSSVVLAILYFFVVGPVSLISRIFQKDHLGMKRGRRKSYWTAYDLKEPTLENMRKQW